MALLVAIRAVLSWPISDPTRRLIEFATHRLIGTVCREYLDRVFFWNAVDLGRKLGEWDYYNEHRVHRSLEGTTPAHRAGVSSCGWRIRKV